MFLEFALNQLDFEFKVSHVYRYSRFSTPVPMVLFSGVRRSRVMRGAVLHVNVAVTFI